jgi:hypothetical protein
MWVRVLPGARVAARLDFAAEDRWAGVRIALDAVTARVVRVEDVDAVKVLCFGVVLCSAADGRRLRL